MSIKIKGYKKGPNDPCPCNSGIKFKNCCLWKYKKAIRDGYTTDKEIMAALVDPQEVIESEKNEVIRFVEEMKNDPELEPGDTIIALAKKHRIDLGEKYTPKEIKHKTSPALFLALASSLSI